MSISRGLLGLILCGLAGASQAAVWSYRAPQGASGGILTSAGPRLLLGTYQGLQASSDGGLSWSRLESLPRWNAVRGIVVDPADAAHWYVQVDEPLPQGNEFAFYVDVRTRVLETRDGGLSWQAPPLPGDALATPLFHPVASSTLVIWYRDALLDTTVRAVSFDGGQNWTAANPALGDPGMRFGVALSSQHFVGLSYSYPPDGIDANLHLSADNGSSWSAPVASLRVSSADILQLSPRASQPQQLLWADATTISFPTPQPGRSGSVDLLTGTVTRFPDVPGLLTELQDDGANPGAVLALVSGADPTCDYCVRQEIWSLPPGAAQWQVRGGFDVGAKRNDFPIAGGLQRNRDGMWLSDSSVGVQYSADAGASWAVRNAGLREAVVNAVALDPRDGTHLLAGRDMQALQRSSDGGVHWSDVGGQVPQDVRSLARSPVNADHLVAAAAGGFYRSLDAGATWQRVATSIDPAPRQRGWRQILWCARNDTHLLATVGDAVYRSLDAGQSWSAVASGTPRLEGARQAAGRTYLLYSGNYSVTADCGATITPLGSFSANRNLAVDPNDDRHLMSTGLGPPSQLRVSTDGGTSWTAIMNPTLYSALNGWFDACDRERYTTHDLRTLRGTVAALVPELPARLSYVNRVFAADSQCIGGESVSVVGTRSGLWLRRATPDLLFADGFGVDY